MHRALRAVYPDHTWLPWLFVPISAGLWKSQETQKQYIEWLEINLGISQPEDWYSVTMDALKEFGGAQSGSNVSGPTCFAHHQT
jgi:hypothetical protein